MDLYYPHGTCQYQITFLLSTNSPGPLLPVDNSKDEVINNSFPT